MFPLRSFIQRSFAVVGFLIPGLVQAAWVETNRIPLPRTVHYFFRVFSDGDYITYGSHYRNFIMDTKTRKEVLVPGPFDAVPTPDHGRILSTPRYTAGLGGMDYYDTQALLRGAKSSDALIYYDDQIQGSYQTIGVLSSNASVTRYRVVTEAVFNKDTGFYYQDYTSITYPDGKISMLPKWEKAKRVCPNVVFTLPMLSKTGRLVGGIDPKTGFTKIMQILEDGNCKVLYNLGLKTGKLDFSFDDTKVAFHVSAKPDADVARVTRIRRYPARSLNLNAMIFDLRTRQFERITACTGNLDCYYPGFTQDGNLVYMEQSPDYNYSFVFLKQQ